MAPLPPNEADWIVQVNESVKLMPSDEQRYWEKRSIYRVPACVTDLNRRAYMPQAVSFGPYHHGEYHLRPMEDHKRRTLLQFLRRSGKPLESFVESLREVAVDLQESYDSQDPKWKKGGGEGVAGRLLELMITDGCFMLEILRTAQQMADDYAHNDPIFSCHGQLYIMPYIRRDMLMLENQLPMLVLDRLLAVESGCQKDDDVNKLILKFYSLGRHTTSLGKCLHILDVFRKGTLMEPTKNVQQELDQMGHDGGEVIIWSATEPDEAGIRFKKTKTDSLKDISFSWGVLRLPMIVVDNTAESMFLNLIAFGRFHVGAGNEVTSYIFFMHNIITAESMFLNLIAFGRFHVGAGNEVTSYIFFMHNIIKNERDVALLHARGIIQNATASDKALVKLFNSLFKDVTHDPNSSLNAVHKKVSRYCKKPWNVWRANLIHTYFKNPWNLWSLSAAIFALVLTIIQTAYTMLSHKP